MLILHIDIEMLNNNRHRLKDVVSKISRDTESYDKVMELVKDHQVDPKKIYIGILFTNFFIIY